MPHVPAICDDCGTVFNSGFFFESARGASFTGCSAGPCPKCGGTGYIPDGIYDFVGNVVQILLSASPRSQNDLAELVRLLRQSRDRNETVDTAAERVERELPAFRRIGEELRRAPITSISALLTLVLTATMAVMEARDPGKKATHVIIEQTINNFVNTPPGTLVAAEKSGPIRRTQQPERNARCPCGSGKKYKNCCGAPKS